MEHRSLLYFGLFLACLTVGILLLTLVFSDLHAVRHLSFIYIALLAIMSIIVHWRTKNALGKNKQHRATAIVLTMISLKLIGSLGLFAGFYFWQKEHIRFFIFPFLIIYFSFTFYEILSLRKLENKMAMPNSNKSQ